MPGFEMGPKGTVVEEETLGRRVELPPEMLERIEKEYVSREEAIAQVKELQNGDPLNPSTAFAKELRIYHLDL